MGNPIGSLHVVAPEEHDHETAREYRCCRGLLHARDGVRVFAAITLLIAGAWMLIGLFFITTVALTSYNVTLAHVDQLSSWLGAPHTSGSSLEEDNHMRYMVHVIVIAVAAVFIVWYLVEFIFALLVFFGVARRKSRLIIPYMADQLLSCLITSALAVFSMVFYRGTTTLTAMRGALIYLGLYAAYTGIAAWTAWKAIRWVRHVKSCEGNPIRMPTVMILPVPAYYKQ